MISDIGYVLSPLAEKIAELALRSMLYEVSISPKPGLVDRIDSGSHEDMDYFSFIRSSSVLAFTFAKCAQAGIDCAETPARDLMKKLRPLGIDGEKRMLEVTNGINTQKGLIFLMGILAAAIGRIITIEEKLNTTSLRNTVKEMSSGICDEELGGLDETNACTPGEMLYLKYGVKGIRGEVECGMPSVFERGLPFLESALDRGADFNAAGLYSLLAIMVKLDDTTILNRHDRDVLTEVKNKADKCLEMGSIFTDDGWNFTHQMKVDFARERVSPGGAADILAASIFLHYIFNEI